MTGFPGGNPSCPDGPLSPFSRRAAIATTYWADPREQLVGQIYTNMYNPPDRSLGTRFGVLTYSAMVQSRP